MENTPMLDQKSNADLNQKIARDILTCVRNKKRPITVLIDGKSAAGKSTMAGVLQEILEKQGQPACVIEADWFLKNRDYRIGELKKVIETGNAYADTHINFWDWDELKRQLKIVYDQALTGGRVSLRNLTIRGESNTAKDIVIPKNAVIFVPGCYLLSQKIAGDLAIMLYVNREEGRRRKMDREYQKNKEGFFPSIDAIGAVILCWELLEEPTFLHHMITCGNKAEIIVDNSGPGKLNIIKYQVELAKSVHEKMLDPDLAWFVYNQSGLGQAIFRLVQSEQPAVVKVQEDGIEFKIAFN